MTSAEPPSTDMDPPRTVVVGISGCSSSGKTTLTRLLRNLFPESFILHEDDFYKPESQLPIKDGLVDWDCPEAISIPDLESALAHVRATGTFPVSSSVPASPSCLNLTHRSNHGCPPSPVPQPLSSPLTPLSSSSSSDLSSSTSSLTTTPTPLPPQQPNVNSIEDLNSVGPCPATPAQIVHCQHKISAWLSPGQPGSLIFPTYSPPSPPNSATQTQTQRRRTRLCLIDGFLLYSPRPAPLSRVTSLLDVKLFLRVSKSAALRRRQTRDGYVTLEGFWKDPPGYVERVVWPNYVEAHRWLFEGGRVEGGRLDKGVLGRERIFALQQQKQQPQEQAGGGEEEEEDVEFGEVLVWAVEVVMKELERICLGEKQVGGGECDGQRKE